MEAAAAKIKEEHEAALTKDAEDHMAVVPDWMSLWIVRRDEGCAELIWIFTPKSDT